MAISIVQSNSGSTGTGSATTIPATLSSGTTAGNVLVLAMAADRYFPSPPTGWTLNANSKNETFLGQYVYTKTATAGETSWNITHAQLTSVSWVVLEVTGVDAAAFDVAAAQFAQSSGNSYTTANLTPTAGERILVAALSGSSSATSLPGVSGWTNSFTENAESWTTKVSGDNNNVGIATRVVVADGSTAYSTSTNWDGGATPQARAAVLLALKGGGNAQPVANAGPNQTVTTSSLVTLDGSGSSDGDGTITDYTWIQKSGPAVTLSSDSVVSPTFTAPSTNSVLVFGLTVTDNNGATSPEDTVIITVTQAELVTAAKIRISGAWEDKPLSIRSGGIWKS